MKGIINELRQLRDNDPDLALVLDVFGEIERVYCETLEAMGVTQKHVPEIRNSAEVTISFRPTSSSSSS